MQLITRYKKMRDERGNHPVDKWQHCVTGYKITQKCGFFTAYIAAIAKEIIDYRDGDKKTNPEVADTIATWVGVALETIVGGSCGDGSSDCDPESLCEDMGINKWKK